MSILNGALAWFMFSCTLFAQETEFNFRDGVCLNSAGQAGLNIGYLGSCGDLNYAPGQHQPRYSFPADLSRADLRGAHLKLNLLSKTRFDDAQLNATDLREAILADASLKRAQALGARFTGAVFWRAKLGDANLQRSNFDGARIREADLHGANLQDASLIAADLTLSRLDTADLRGANLTRAILLATSLTKARFDGRTRLPFSNEQAIAYGMVYTP